MLAILTILAMLNTVPPRPDAPPPPSVYFTLLETNGTSKIVTVQQLDSGTIATTDLDGRRRTEPFSKVIMLSRATLQPPQMPRFGASTVEVTPISPKGVLFTVDGQVIAGQMVKESAGNDSVLWQSPLAGTLRVPLDLLRRLDCTYPPSALYDGLEVTRDTLMLRNGDVIEGFVNSIGREIKIETGTEQHKQIVTLPLDRVEVILLAQNQSVPKGTIVATRGGLVVQILTPHIRDRVIEGEVSLGSKGERISISDAELETLVFDAGRVLPLALCKFQDAVAPNGRAWAQPIEFRNLQRGGYASELELPGPMQVDCDLPKGATRLLFNAELPHSCRTWGDPELVVSVASGKGFRELYRVKLTGDAPEVDANLEISGALRLRLTVEAGTGGPIQDRVTLRRALIVIDSASLSGGKPAPNQ